MMRSFNFWHTLMLHLLWKPASRAQARTTSVTLASHRFLQTTQWITLPRLFSNPRTRLTHGTATRPTLLGMHQPPSTRQRNETS
ncbi:hypothetical protein BDP55DRAFT_684526 [Colletotrichum godetiae]|uniref:Secreted protein n=1 Tax=Colletotrichum godetiae TaxID=1209918 RepID=A0AAJ0A726_9PEZI|nr:uncharacterized protein BDP55DRAFT_684526 [Colletotrichum godetiae]KAK1657729.1 hypothetical protein BDP55DRAFT_684526 [Colletotrichum godetiae]